MPTFTSSSVSHITAGQTAGVSTALQTYESALNALVGAWTPYTPTLTGFTPGNGTPSGQYIQIGKLVHFEAKFTFGSTSAAATAIPTLTLPVPANATATSLANVRGAYLKSGVNWNLAAAQVSTTTAVQVAIIGTSGLFGTPTTTTPFTWATLDTIYAAGTYQAA